MAVSERARLDLYSKLQKTIGEQEATTLIEYLPPVGWADVATKADLGLLKRDIDELRRGMDARFEMVRLEFAGLLDRRLSEAVRTIVFAMFGAFIAFSGVIIAALKIG